MDGQDSGGFTDEDRRNLSTLAEEVPRIRTLVEELTVTLDVLGDEELVEGIKVGMRELRGGETVGYGDLLRELGLHEREV